MEIWNAGDEFIGISGAGCRQGAGARGWCVGVLEVVSGCRVVVIVTAIARLLHVLQTSVVMQAEEPLDTISSF